MKRWFVRNLSDVIHFLYEITTSRPAQPTIITEPEPLIKKILSSASIQVLGLKIENGLINHYIVTFILKFIERTKK